MAQLAVALVEEYMGEPGNPGHEQLQKKLALWASGWSLDIAREKAVQGAYFPPSSPAGNPRRALGRWAPPPGDLGAGWE